jgi:AraC-like DNA-binding protein
MMKKKNQFTIADGCCEMVFKFVKIKNEISPENLIGKYIIGQKTKFKSFEINCDDIFIGIKIYPGYIYPFVNQPMNEITDRSVFMDLINEKLFPNMKKYTNEVEFCIIIQNEIKKHYEKNRIIDNKIKNALKYIINYNGIINLKDLSKEICLSPRDLERKFLHFVGISPKKYSQLVRFNHSRNKLLFSKEKKIVDIALSAGYYDQSHFNRDFKKFTGLAPFEFHSFMANNKDMSITL